MKYPKISLVTTCYNHKDYIAETIESILSQNYPNLEYIVIDDGSTDGSWDIIQKYKDKLTLCERIEGYRDTPTVAINYAFSKTNGEIMGWLNSDDILLPKCLLNLKKIFEENPDVSWITGMASTININSLIVNSNLRFKSKYDYLIGDWAVIQQESTFWRRDLWDKAGSKLEGKYKWAFDTELWTRFFMLAEHTHVNTLLGAFRKGVQSKSISDEKSFSTPSEEYLKEMKQRIGLKLKFEVWFYYFCKKIFWPIFFLLPQKVIKHTPLLKKYTYSLLEYSFEDDLWKKKKINPFKRCF